MCHSQIYMYSHIYIYFNISKGTPIVASSGSTSGSSRVSVSVPLKLAITPTTGRPNSLGSSSTRTSIVCHPQMAVIKKEGPIASKPNLHQALPILLQQVSV